MLSHAVPTPSRLHTLRNVTKHIKLQMERVQPRGFSLSSRLNDLLMNKPGSESICPDFVYFHLTFPCQTLGSLPSAQKGAIVFILLQVVEKLRPLMGQDQAQLLSQTHLLQMWQTSAQRAQGREAGRLVSVIRPL